eukprot:TRINITY_DN18665_c0_g1_i1.p1 TRINITY_DN18665_c0_g1~~TRINITY_DN18665_c0_g1_i1.p1  ORF type:complete len:121 (-),score=35.62 TRINITY_DN18665_c0_g1_i1:170-532(-)
MIRRPPRSTQGVSSAASDVYKRQNASCVQFIKGITRKQNNVRSCDKDNSDTIEEEEINAYLRSFLGAKGMSDESAEKKIKELFMDIDKDKNSIIDRKELGEFLQKIFLGQLENLAKQLGK